MATACIPWDETYSFDESLFRKQVSHLIKNDIKSIYLFGTAGEGYAVNDRQFSEIIGAFKSETKNTDAMPMIGIISTSLPQITDRINMALKLGFRDFQISFPSWGRLSQEEMLLFFDSILPKYPDCRFMHYNNGARSRLLLKVEDYEKLCDRYENLAAVKFPGFVNITDIYKAASLNLPIQFFPLEFGYGELRPLTECGIILSYLNMSYKTAKKYFKAGIERDFAEIKRIHFEIITAKNMFEKMLPSEKMDGAYDKIYVKTALPKFPLRLLPPYKGISEQEYSHYIEKINESLPGWFI